MSWTQLDDRRVKARKAHRCIWCAQDIAVGEAYDYVTGVSYGDFQANHWHPECKDAAWKELKESGEDEFTPWDNARPDMQTEAPASSAGRSKE